LLWFITALLSSFLSASSAIVQKKVLFIREPLEFSFILALFNLVFSIPFFFFIDFSVINSFSLVVLLIKSLIGVFAFLSVMTALKNLQISSALPLLALTPGFVAVFAYIFLGEVLTLLEITGLTLLTVGTYILESKNLKEFIYPFSLFLKSKYHRYILVALLLFTASSILDKLLLVKLSFTPISLTAFQHLYFAFIFLIIFLMARIVGKVSSENKYKSVFDFAPLFKDKSDFGWIILISLMTIGYRFTQVAAVSVGSVALTLAVKRTSVLWATIIGGKLFKDANLLKKTVAVILIVIGAIMILRN
jgi:drug/metabolite transporter (DMT)-like permease